MRSNLPVSDVEYFMQDGKPIVSKTDLKGRITYVNPYFIEVSGYTHEELLGAPHNLVRHPGMPPEAFADMWETLKAGIPWNGMVKNRRKNGAEPGRTWPPDGLLTCALAAGRLHRSVEFAATHGYPQENQKSAAG